MGLSLEDLELPEIEEDSAADPMTTLLSHHRKYEAKQDLVQSMLENVNAAGTAINHCLEQHECQVKAFKVALVNLYSNSL